MTFSLNCTQVLQVQVHQSRTNIWTVRTITGTVHSETSCHCWLAHVLFTLSLNSQQHTHTQTQLTSVLRQRIDNIYDHF